MYADDTTLSTTLHTNSLCTTSINEGLTKINNWLQINKLSLNVKKTKCMIFHNRNKRFTPPLLHIDNIPIQRVTSFNFLGLTMDEHLDWKCHINKIASKISRACGIINRLKNTLPIEVRLTLYNSLILPHMNYNLLIWGHLQSRISKLQKKAIRIVTNSTYSAHTEPLFKIMNVLKLDDIYLIAKVKFYHKFINNNLPPAFSNLSFPSGENRHEHNTRQKKALVQPTTKHKFAFASILFSIPKAINGLPQCINDKFLTHSLKGQCLYLKNRLLSGYELECKLVNCYTCARKSHQTILPPSNENPIQV